MEMYEVDDMIPKSRLEKFLKAIITMEVDDLPVPLSRLEELYNCLATGEEPNVREPISRAEIFLLTAMGMWDDELPEPQSRAEVLLYMLATGESDLTNIKYPQSNYEILLAYLIQKGGILGDYELSDVLLCDESGNSIVDENDNYILLGRTRVKK